MNPAVLGAGPGQIFVTHQQLITRMLGLLALVILLVLLLNKLAARAGGWRAIRRRCAHEVRLTAAAFVAPGRRWLSYQRRVRALRRLIRDPEGWRGTERAVRGAYVILDADSNRDGNAARPYAALFDGTEIGVLVAGREVPAPPAPWEADADDPRLWWLSRGVAGVIPAEVDGMPPVLLASIGLRGRHMVLLDLAGGPRCVAVDGDPRAVSGLVQSIAAQLDRRLPVGAVAVADGVHAGHPGPTAESAVALVEARPTRESPGFAVCAGMPPTPTTAGTDVRLLVAGPGRGHVRMLTTDGAGQVVVHGTPLRANAAALPRAMSRAVRLVPPYEPPGGPLAATPAPRWGETTLGRSSAQLVADGSADRSADRSADTSPGRSADTSAGRSAVGVAGVAGRPVAPVDELTEAGPQESTFGVSAGGDGRSDQARRDMVATPQESAAGPPRADPAIGQNRPPGGRGER